MQAMSEALMGEVNRAEMFSPKSKDSAEKAQL